MARLIIGVTVCAGIRTKALAISGNCRRAAHFTSATEAGTLNNSRCH